MDIEVKVKILSLLFVICAMVLIAGQITKTNENYKVVRIYENISLTISILIIHAILNYFFTKEILVTNLFNIDISLNNILIFIIIISSITLIYYLATLLKCKINKINKIININKIYK